MNHWLERTLRNHLVIFLAFQQDSIYFERKIQIHFLHPKGREGAGPGRVSEHTLRWEWEREMRNFSAQWDLWACMLWSLGFALIEMDGEGLRSGSAGRMLTLTCLKPWALFEPGVVYMPIVLAFRGWKKVRNPRSSSAMWRIQDQSGMHTSQS